MTDEDIKRLLENKHTARLIWLEPWAATGPEGDATSANITISATVQDCINLARNMAKVHGRPIPGDEREFLLDFIAVFWAQEVHNGDSF